MYQSPACVLRERCVIRNEWPLHLTQRQPASVAHIPIGIRAASFSLGQIAIQELPLSEEGVVLLSTASAVTAVDAHLAIRRIPSHLQHGRL